MSRIALLCAAAFLSLIAAVPAGAVVIASGDGTGNTTAPADDPGWDYLGVMGGVSAVYLGDGWVLTAGHVIVSPVSLMGQQYDPVAGTETFIDTADLKVFALHGFPDLPLLPIRATLPGMGALVVMGGKGLDRGASTSCNPTGPGGPNGGWLVGPTANRRWGTNLISSHLTVVNQSLGTTTESFATTFDAGLPTPHEAQAAIGDSGGAVWVEDGGQWELAGILFGTASCWPNTAAIFTDETYAADLSLYRDEILDIVALPEPGTALGMASGAGFLLLLGRRRMRP